ncbi:hypothetical protein CGRA01v4_06105 [Colletotrichum graminicola]|nr:hypothetical protein CGRA01v4_06105 [Colletotrichum graminicola]
MEHYKTGMFSLLALLHANPWEEQTLQLYTMGDVLCDLPTGNGISFTDGPCNNIIFANDSSLRPGAELKGIGRFPDPQTAVRIPTWQRYVEALMLTSLRREENCGWYGEYLYMRDCGDAGKLGPGFREFHRGLRPGQHRAAWAEAAEDLGPRIRRPRPRPSVVISSIWS